MLRRAVLSRVNGNATPAGMQVLKIGRLIVPLASLGAASYAKHYYTE